MKLHHIFSRGHVAIIKNPRQGDSGRFKYPADMPRIGAGKPRKTRKKLLQTVWQ